MPGVHNIQKNLILIDLTNLLKGIAPLSKMKDWKEWQIKTLLIKTLLYVKYYREEQVY